MPNSQNKSTDTATFASLGLSPGSLSALTHAGWKAPTPIQQRTIPPAVAGKDVIGCAATGTGKTGSFILPIVERLKNRPGAQALVLAPTRELALQIAEQAETFGKPMGLGNAAIIGGVGMGEQAKALRDRRSILIATPGRLNDHLDGGARLAGVEILVLDEADRMLDMGFKPQLERILQHVPAKRQTLLFSATMSPEVENFGRKALKSPERVEVARSGTVAERAEQRVYLVDQLEKLPLLLAIASEDEGSTLVFTRTKRRADRVAQVLQKAGHKVARIHADRTQGQRKAALEGFKSGAYRILVATDIAARGIDVEEIAHVVNFDLPHVPEDYIHRVGRTARASASGRASSFCSHEERPLLKAIEKLTRMAIVQSEVPRHSEIFKAAVVKREAAQRHPGPAQHSHGVSQRPAGQQPGRHARTHPKKASSSGQQQPAQGERTERRERTSEGGGGHSYRPSRRWRPQR